MIDSNISQLPLFSAMHSPDEESDELASIYGVDETTSCDARVALERKYKSILVTSKQFNRQIVSYQGNKQIPLHRWLKYKEGFSAHLVNTFFDTYQINSGQQVFDPFAGSGTTLLVAQQRGIYSVGIELLPINQLMWSVKAAYPHYDVAHLKEIRAWVSYHEPSIGKKGFPHIPITESAFSPEREQQFMWYQEQLPQLAKDTITKQLLDFVLMSILEDISFTRKDGQYLRWDTRSEKAKQRDSKRIEQGKPPYKPFSKNTISEVKAAILESLDQIIVDVALLQGWPAPESTQQLIAGTVLRELPYIGNSCFDLVITSPPYCNRYDYTRTYALELAYLQLTHQDVVSLRQAQLSCTVENQSKVEELEQFYAEIERHHDFATIMNTVNGNEALQEVFSALEQRAVQGELNNVGVVQMVQGYFTELAFVIFELFRTCRAGAHVVMVNDNVRYGGEIIPVDLLMTDLAVAFGFEPEIIHVLSQRKGNSSQQMGKFGREALRKSIIVWRKPSENE